METKCEIKNCSWSGPAQYLFLHCETHHLQAIKVLLHNRLDFSFEDMADSTYLVCCIYGMYWMKIKKDEDDAENYFKIGMFNTVDSNAVDFKLKIGTHNFDAFFIGPYLSETDGSRHFSIRICRQELLYFRTAFPDRWTLIIGCNEEAKILGIIIDRLQYLDNLTDVNEVLVEHFVCTICYEYLNNQPIIVCANNHYTCFDCFQTMRRNRFNVQCPKCCDIVGLHSRKMNIERFIRRLDFPVEIENADGNETDDSGVHDM